MTRTLLLCCGSRALADTPAAEAWAREQLRAAIDALPADACVVTGDASGPDTWALEAACPHGLQVVVCRLDGALAYHKAAGPAWTARRWCSEDYARFGRRHDRTWPLERNRAMVARVAAARGWSARVLALEAPWSATWGTAHTAGLARQAGLVVDARTAPAELGPGRGARS